MEIWIEMDDTSWMREQLLNNLWINVQCSTVAVPQKDKYVYQSLKKLLLIKPKNVSDKLTSVDTEILKINASQYRHYHSQNLPHQLPARKLFWNVLGNSSRELVIRKVSWARSRLTRTNLLSLNMLRFLFNILLFLNYLWFNDAILPKFFLSLTVSMDDGFVKTKQSED